MSSLALLDHHRQGLAETLRRLELPIHRASSSGPPELIDRNS
jgi:hypothetical protein